MVAKVLQKFRLEADERSRSVPELILRPKNGVSVRLFPR